MVLLASSCHPKAEAFTPVALSPASLSLDAGGYALRPDHFKTYPGRTYRHAEPVLGLGMTAFAANKREGAAASLAASTICTMLPREGVPVIRPHARACEGVRAVEQDRQ